MNNASNKIYFIAMIELLINEHNVTDLGTHLLEYKLDFSSVGGDEMIDGDACLAIAVRLKSKDSKDIKWGRIYYKPLIKKHTAYGEEARKKLKSILYTIQNSSIDEKLDFITNLENRLLKRCYVKSSFVDPVLADFFENLNYSLYDGYPATDLGRPFPKELVPCVDSVFNEIVPNVLEPFKSYKGKK